MSEYTDKMLFEAETEILRLRAENEKLRAALAAERTRCVKIAETMPIKKYFCPSTDFGMGFEAARDDIAAAIRERKR